MYPASPMRRQQWLQQVDLALRTKGLEVAAQLALKALAEGVEEPSLLNLAASTHYVEGRFDQAVQLLTRARTLAPRDPNVLNSLGVCLKGAGRLDEALRAFGTALEAEPRMAAAHFNRGTVFDDLNDMAGARSAYEQAVALDADYVDALSSLAWVAAQMGDAASARAHGERALARSPINLLARMALASADLQEGDLNSAAGRLARLREDPELTLVNRSIVIGLIGDLNDAANRPAEAFAAYTASNAELKALNKDRFETPGQETALERVERLIRWFEKADLGPWRQAPATRPSPGDPKTHIFLVGFPRSGTTLLENILLAHPQVVSLEEKDTLVAAEGNYLSSDEGLARLAQIELADAAHQRDAYWQIVRSFGIDPGGRIFMDKMPLASVQLPLISKLFPEARVLFARRDPRDVVLSCFRRRFAMNPSMYQLLTLESAAVHYDAVMRVSELYRDRLPLEQHIVRYESLVDDFEGTARSACDFLGLEWNEALFDFAAKARMRAIGTPSAAQVVRGLNREGQGTWRRYREQMAPVLGLLEPWVERFGYSSASACDSVIRCGRVASSPRRRILSSS